MTVVVLAVEGPDCSGKSTFVERLCEALDDHRIPWHRLKFGPPDPADRDVYEEYEQQLDRYDDGDTVLVCDRLHWGERVYGPLLRKHDRLGRAGWRHVELSLAARGTLVLYAAVDSASVARCLEQRGDHLVGVDDLYYIYRSYQICMEETALPVLHLPHLDDEATVNFVLRTVNELYRTRPAVSGFDLSESYVGPLPPKLLLFGEHRGGKPPHGGDRSAFVPRNSGSGRWLLEALPDDLWPRVGLANACDQDDPRRVWIELGRPATIALGHLAHEALVEAEVPHAAAPHPQFVRRFLHGSLDDYGELLRDLAGTEHVNLDWRGMVTSIEVTT